MAFDDVVAERVRDALAERSDIAEKRMFGGLAFLLSGNMCVGVVKDELMVRVGPDAYDDLVGRPHAREMDFSGRPMMGWVYVAPQGFAADADLRHWVGYGVAFAGSLPGK
jgi:TfoX/Sxy family transcriptional regulator of competence genes